MNNKKIFSVHLFWQTIKQTKIMGLLFTAMIAFYSVMNIVLSADNLRNLHEQMTITGVSEGTNLLVVVFLFAPILALTIWAFQNKRNSSDFYGALPYTKLCIFTSKTVAIVSWIVFMTLLSYILRVSLYLIYRDCFIVSFDVMTQMYVAILICSLYVIAAICLAASITGNMISTICVTGMVVYLPRFITTLLNYMAYVHGDEYMMMEYGAGILNNSRNMVFGVTLGNMFGTSVKFRTIFLSPVNNIYTFVLALIFFVCAACFYRHRPSEIAGKSAYGKVMPMLIRTLIVFVISVMATSMAMSMTDAGEIVEIIIILFFIAAVTVIIFEVISNRRGRIIRNCIPAIISGYILAVIFGFVGDAYGKMEASYVPDAKDVSVVSFCEAYTYDDEYYSNMTSELNIRNEDIITLFTDAFTRTKNNCDNDIRNRFNGERYLLKVKFKEAFISRYRYVVLNKSEQEKLSEYLMKDEAYLKAYLDVPNSDKAKLSCEFSIDDDVLKEAYDVLIEESKEMKFSDWYVNQNEIEPQFEINSVFAKSGTNYFAGMNITELTPKAFKTLVQKNNENVSENYKNELKVMEEYFRTASENKKMTYNQSDEEYLNISLNFTYPGGKYYTNVEDYITSPYSQDSDSENMRQLFGLVADELKKGKLDNEVDPDKVFLTIEYYKSEMNTIEDKKFIVIIQIDGYDSLSDLGIQTE